MKTLILANVKTDENSRPFWTALGPVDKIVTPAEAAEMVRKSYSAVQKLFEVKLKTIEDNMDFNVTEEIYKADCEGQNAVVPVEMMLEITRLQDVIHEAFENRSNFNSTFMVFLFSLGTLVTQIIVLILLLLLR